MSKRNGSVGAGEEPVTADDSEDVPAAGSSTPIEEPAAGIPYQQERIANRIGPVHPAHWGHAQWLEERGLDANWDKTYYQQHPDF